MKLNYEYRDSCYLFEDWWGKRAKFIRKTAKPGLYKFGDMMGADDDHLGVDIEVYLDENGRRRFTGYLRTHWNKTKAIQFNNVNHLMTLLSWNDTDLTSWFPVEKYKGKYRLIMEKTLLQKGMQDGGVVAQMMGF